MNDEVNAARKQLDKDLKVLQKHVSSQKKQKKGEIDPLKDCLVNVRASFKRLCEAIDDATSLPVSWKRQSIPEQTE